MKETRLSLIFCCYNVSRYLNDIFSWIDNNIDSKIEIIFVEDKSTDKTKELLQNYSNRKQENIILTLNESNQGLSESRNIGFRHAKGEYIGFPDPDDLFDNRWINELLDIIDAQSPDVIITGMREDYEIDHIHKYSKNVLCDTKSGFISKDDFSTTLLELENIQLFGYMNNKIYRRAIIEENNLVCKKLALKEDFEFNVNLFSIINNFYILNKPYYFYKKRNNNSLTTKHVVDYWDIHKKSVFSFKRLLEENSSLSLDSKSLLVNRFFRYFLSAIERNTNLESGMSFKEQRNWILKAFKDEDSKFYFDNINLLSGKLKYLSIFFKNKMGRCLVLMGRIIKKIKKYLPILFSKLKG